MIDYKEGGVDMKNNIFVIVLVVALAAGGLWYIKNSKTPSPAMEKTEETVTPGAAMPASDSAGTKETVIDDNAKEIVINASEFRFSPATLTVKKGEPIKLTLKNVGKMPHDFVIDELGIRTKKIAGGDTDTIVFTPEQAGVFEYYCSVGSHRALGMVGKITIE
jgi:plastocyanin